MAFDLEEAASQGSLVFVQDWLLPQLLRQTGASFQGAIILDSILHFNDTINSQKIATDWDKLVPDAVDDIRNNQSGYLIQMMHVRERLTLNFVDKGDFLALIQRNGEKDAVIAQTLQRKWKMINQSNKFKLVDFRLNIPEVALITDHITITPSGWKIV